MYRLEFGGPRLGRVEKDRIEGEMVGGRDIGEEGEEI